MSSQDVTIEVPLNHANNSEKNSQKPSSSPDNIGASSKVSEEQGQPTTEANGVNSSENNEYARNRDKAKGLMDIALLTSNANQLRYLLYARDDSVLFYFNLVLVISSLALQIANAFLMVFTECLHRPPLKYLKLYRMVKMEELLVMGLFMVVAINILLAAFPQKDLRGIPHPTLNITSR